MDWGLNKTMTLGAGLFLALTAHLALAQSSGAGAIPQTSASGSGATATLSDQADVSQPKPSGSHLWDFHFQSTLIGQSVLPFSAQYSGPNSLESHGEVKDTFSFDVTGRVQLWRGADFYADALSWQGYGLSKTTGAAGFPNGEAYRVGKTYPDASIVRAYLQETIGLGGGEEPDPDSPSGFGGQRDARRLTLTVGHFSATDFFDKNSYAGDARGQFMNWALISNTAWDYPANTLGFTNGAAAELEMHSWAARAGMFQVSRVANAIRMDWNVGQAHSLAGEIERRFAPAGHPGAVRLLAYRTSAHMGNYQESLSSPQNIQVNGQIGYRTKYGFGINTEQEIRKNVGAFMRLGWSDGKNETWEFTDVDRTGSAGLSLKGEAWGRPGDSVGLAAVVNGISAVHRQFLANGGLGITVGDGALDYRSERLAETYYKWKLAKRFELTLDYQLVINPAYNHARGPANILATRLHWEF